MRIFSAISVFFKCIFDSAFLFKVKNLDQTHREFADLQVLHEKVQAEYKLEIQKLKHAPKKEETGEFQEGACALLSLMQSEARFLDFVQENLEPVSDEQVGSIVRMIHKDLFRLFDQYVKIRPVLVAREGENVRLEAGTDMNEIRLCKNVEATLPLSGKLIHKGWMVQSVNLPKRQKSQRGFILCPAQIEVESSK